jgi:biopolymer transport protein TolQ
MALDPVSLDPLALLRQASLPVRSTAGLLALASAAVWAVGVFKLLQLSRLSALQQRFELHARRADTRNDLDVVTAEIPDAPGARIVSAMTSIGSAPKERIRAVAERAIVEERRHATSLVGVLGSCASAAPFVGLFGTVYGIMDAFVRIGAERSASLPVVAPAIGEALLTTAIGLAAAIPAVIFFNAIDRRVAELCAALETSAPEWVEIAANVGLDPRSARSVRAHDPHAQGRSMPREAL